MAQYGSRLLKRETVARDTAAFYFAKPVGLQFRPGQSMDMTLVDPPETDGEGNRRTFSIASPPFEDELLFVTRMRNTAFKRVLGAMPPGTEVRLTGPAGSFTLHRDAVKPGVFLAGGIGVTPFLSIIRQVAHDNGPYRLTLFYSNRRPEDACYLDVLRALSGLRPDIRCVPTMTGVEKSSGNWAGETGHVNRAMLLKYLPGLRGHVYYIAGPPGMVSAVRDMLVDAGVPEDDIRSEEFGGY